MQLEPLQILCFGDSLTAGYSPSTQSFTPYAPDLAAALSRPDVAARDVAFSGFTSGDLLNAAEVATTAPISGELLPGLLLSLQQVHFALVVILAGTNDLGHMYRDVRDPVELQRRCDELLDNLQALHTKVRDKGIGTVAMGIPQSAFLHATPQMDKCRRTVNQELQTWMEDRGRADGLIARFVDFPIAFSEAERNAGHWDLDGLHLSPSGYSELGRRLAAELPLPTTSS